MPGCTPKAARSQSKLSWRNKSVQCRKGAVSERETVFKRGWVVKRSSHSLDRLSICIALKYFNYFALREKMGKCTNQSFISDISACDPHGSSVLRREDNCGYLQAHVLPFGLEPGHDGGWAWWSSLFRHKHPLCPDLELTLDLFWGWLRKV